MARHIVFDGKKPQYAMEFWRLGEVLAPGRPTSWDTQTVSAAWLMYRMHQNMGSLREPQEFAMWVGQYMAMWAQGVFEAPQLAAWEKSTGWMCVWTDIFNPGIVTEIAEHSGVVWLIDLRPLVDALLLHGEPE